MSIKVTIAGVTGSVGSALVEAISGGTEFQIVSAVGRSRAGENLGKVLNLPNVDVVISGSVEEALNARPDVFIDYTHPSVIREHCLLALKAKIPTVVGTSGLTKEQLDELGALAAENGVGVFAAGNFSITAALQKHLSVIAARYLPSWEIIDYGKPKYVHVPSSTASEMADAMAAVRRPEAIASPGEVRGLKEARGATVSGAQLHSIRSPGFGFSVETIFGLHGERLVLRHDAFESPEPYVYGTLLAAREVRSFVGLKRGIDSLLFKE